MDIACFTPYKTAVREIWIYPTIDTFFNLLKHANIYISDASNCSHPRLSSIYFALLFLQYLFTNSFFTEYFNVYLHCFSRFLVSILLKKIENNADIPCITKYVLLYINVNSSEYSVIEYLVVIIPAGWPPPGNILDFSWNFRRYLESPEKLKIFI